MFGCGARSLAVARTFKIFVVVVSAGLVFVHAHLLHQIGTPVFPEKTGDFLIAFEM
jgi:hypothetical protein